MTDLSADRWSLTSSGWRHRPWAKVLANTILRGIQRGQTKWLVRSICEEVAGDDRPRCIGYDFGPVEFEQ